MRFSAGTTTLVTMTGASLLLSGDVDIEEAVFTPLHYRVQADSPRKMAKTKEV